MEKSPKSIYLDRLQFLRNDTHKLISRTFAGSTRVELESVEETLTKLLDRFKDMSEEQFKQWISA